MKITDLFVDEVEDRYARENFRKILEVLKVDSLLQSDFTHYEFEFPVAVTDQDIQHKLNFIPLDLIQTYLTPGVTVSWIYDKFTRDTIRLTTSGACRIRFFIGSYKKRKAT